MSEAKRHRCPGCGTNHMGFTRLCGFCLAGMEGTPVVTNVTATVTGRGFSTGKGRLRKHKSNAARQAAWRKNND